MTNEKTKLQQKPTSGWPSRVHFSSAIQNTNVPAFIVKGVPKILCATGRPRRRIELSSMSSILRPQMTYTKLLAILQNVKKSSINSSSQQTIHVIHRKRTHKRLALWIMSTMSLICSIFSAGVSNQTLKAWESRARIFFPGYAVM
jgi:hypothetical protein